MNDATVYRDLFLFVATLLLLAVGLAVHLLKVADREREAADFRQEILDELSDEVEKLEVRAETAQRQLDEALELNRGWQHWHDALVELQPRDSLVAPAEVEQHLREVTG